VVRQAEQALRLCGYDVVKGCCDKGCTTAGCSTGCSNGCAPAAGPAVAPMMDNGAPAPVPPEEKKASNSRSRMSTLLGLLN
jgi:hypothetical protein